MKRYLVRVRVRNSALTNDWYYSEKQKFIIEARNEDSAMNKLDKMARKLNNDYRRLETELIEVK